jgi:hypothetical protein
VEDQTGSAIGLEFWFGGTSDSRAVRAVADALRMLGGDIGSLVTVFDKVPEEPYGSVTEQRRHVVTLATDGELDDLAKRGVLAAVEVSNVVTFSSRPVVVTLSYTRSPSLYHPICILLPDLINWAARRARPDPTGIETRQLFRRLCGILCPSYAGIFVEFTMPDPPNMPGNGAFMRDVFFRGSYLGPQGIAKIASASGLGSTDGNDLFVFTTPEFGPPNAAPGETYARVVERALSRAGAAGRWS